MLQRGRDPSESVVEWCGFGAGTCGTRGWGAALSGVLGLGGFSAICDHLDEDHASCQDQPLAAPERARFGPPLRRIQRWLADTGRRNEVMGWASIEQAVVRIEKATSVTLMAFNVSTAIYMYQG